MFHIFNFKDFFFLSIVAVFSHGQAPPTLTEEAGDDERNRWIFKKPEFTGDPKVPYYYPSPYNDVYNNTRTLSVPLLTPSQEKHFVIMFSLSYMAEENVVEQWWDDTMGKSPSKKNPFRLSRVFQDIGFDRDSNGAVCIGESFKAEVCIQAIDCVEPVNGVVHIPTPVVSNYRLEAMEIDETLMAQLTGAETVEQVRRDINKICRADRVEYGKTDIEKIGFAEQSPLLTHRNHARQIKDLDQSTGDFVLQYMYTALWQREITDKTYEPLEFTLPYLDAPAYWLGLSTIPQNGSPLQQTSSWMTMMASTLQQLKGMLPTADHAERVLFAEFGVASGKTTAFIANWLRKELPLARLHALDSFVGIPEEWNGLPQGTFGMQDEHPEILNEFKNIEIHKGWFNTTKFELDDATFVGFLHIDVDLYSSAREVLLHFACRMGPGTVLVFDEFMNYFNWSRDGEFLALQEVAAMVGISYEFFGIYHEQSVPILITDNDRLICAPEEQ